MIFTNSITKFRHYSFNNRIMSRAYSIKNNINTVSNDNNFKFRNLENEINYLKDKNFNLIMKIKDIQNQLNHINNNRFIEVYKEIHKFQDFKKN